MANKIALGSPCSVCGQDSWWDNRVGRSNPKAPEYKCGTRDCKDPATGYPPGRWERDRAKWGNISPQNAPPAPQEPTGAPKGGRITPDDTTPDERGERVYTWTALAHTYGILTRAVVKGMLGAGLGEVVEGGAEGPRQIILDQSAVQAGVATLLIQGEKAHIPLLHPRKATVQDVQKPAPKKPEPKDGGHLNPEPEDWEAMEAGDWP